MQWTYSEHENDVSVQTFQNYVHFYILILSCIRTSEKNALWRLLTYSLSYVNCSNIFGMLECYDCFDAVFTLF